MLLNISWIIVSVTFLFLLINQLVMYWLTAYKPIDFQHLSIYSLLINAINQWFVKYCLKLLNLLLLLYKLFILQKSNKDEDWVWIIHGGNILAIIIYILYKHSFTLLQLLNIIENTKNLIFYFFFFNCLPDNVLKIVLSWLKICLGNPYFSEFW